LFTKLLDSARQSFYLTVLYLRHDLISLIFMFNLLWDLYLSDLLDALVYNCDVHVGCLVTRAHAHTQMLWFIIREMIFIQHIVYNNYTTHLHGVGPMWMRTTTGVPSYVSALCNDHFPYVTCMLVFGYTRTCPQVLPLQTL
jgi:hypothetical protein